MRRLAPGVRCALACGGLLLAVACATAGPRNDLEAWSRGPVRWLLLPAEQRALASVEGALAVERFVDSFWRRRDPAIAAAFALRVDAADRLYGADADRGSLSDRGRALILLGPPPILRTTYRTVPTWSPTHARTPIARQTLRVEVWVYPLAELPATLRTAFAEHPEVVVSFALEPDRTRLLDGEGYLDLARRAYVSAPLPADD